jgi:hypothetical protein
VKTVLSILVTLVLVSGIALAAGIDGKWGSEMKRQNPNGEEMVVKTVFDLKAEGSTLTGSVTTSMGGGEGRTAKISDGKIDGNKFSFTLVQETPRGEMKSKYEGTVEGDTLKGTRAMEGREGRPFEAKRQ